jgi:predicted membrane protein
MQTSDTAPTPPAGPPPEETQRRRKTDRRLLGLVLLVVGTWWFLQQVGLFHPSSKFVLSTILILIGLWLMFTARRRATGWPVIVGGVLLLVLLSPRVPAPRMNGGSFGNPTYAPLTVDDIQPRYENTAGNIDVDFSNVSFPPAGDKSTIVRDDFGNATVTLPGAVPVELSVSNSAGSVAVPGERETGGVGVRRTYHFPAECGATNQQFVLHVSVDVQFGRIDVMRNCASPPLAPKVSSVKS